MEKLYLKTLSLIIGLCFCGALGLAQLPNGSVAPNFTVTDLNGNVHNLQTYLDQGKTVVLDWSATWCGPCWNYHNSHALADLYTQYGPNGTDEMMVFMMEGDQDTELECLYGPTGCTGGTQGDWVTGTPYPIVEITDPSITSAYQIGYWPTIYTICPDGYIYESGQSATSIHASWRQSCEFELDFVSATGMDCYSQQSGTIDIDASGGAGTISYSWSNGATTQDLTNVHPGYYTCTATEGNGLQRVIEDILVEGPTSEVIIDLVTESNVTCHGAGDGQIDIEAFGGTPGYSYSWSNGATTQDVTNLPGGVYDVIVTDDNNCSKTQSFEIVDPDPVVSVGITATVENCDRGDALLSVEGTGGTGVLRYSYRGEQNMTGVFDNLHAGTDDVMIWDDNNCTYTESVTIEEIPSPIADVFDVDDPIDCQNSTIQLGAVASVGPEFQYIWSTIDGNIVSGANSLTPVVDAAGTYNFVVRNTTNNCLSEDFVVVESNQDLPDIAFEVPAMFTCSTTEVVVDASNSSSGSNYQYQWNTDNGEILSGGSSNQVTVGTPGTYTLTIINTDNGCESTESIDVLGDSDVPVATIEGLGSVDCAHLEIDLDGSSSSQGDDFEYEWNTDDGTILSTDGDQAVVSEPGTYVLTVTNTLTGCWSQAVFTVADNREYVEAGFEVSTDQLEVDLQNLSTGNPNEIQWDMGNGEIIDGNIDSYTYSEPGVYTICLTVANGCGDDVECIEIEIKKKVIDVFYGDIVDYDDLGFTKPTQELNGDQNNGSSQKLADVQIYPNPTAGSFTLELNEQKFIKQFAIVNIDGKTMIHQNVNAERGQISIDGRALQNGTYFVQIQLENELIVKQLIVIK